MFYIQLSKCGKAGCPDEVTDDAVQCVLCKKWFHSLCADLTEDEIEVLKIQIRWFCESCEGNIEKLQVKVTTVPDEENVKNEDLERENNELKKKIQECEEEVKHHKILENDK